MFAKRVRIVAAIAAGLGLCGIAHAAVDINGGSSWGGWTLQGQSNAVGVYGSGVSTNPYEIYTTLFSYDSATNTVTGSPTGGGGTVTGGFGGGFDDGDTVLGIGLRMIGGESIVGATYTLKIDIGSDSYLAATSIDGGNGSNPPSGTGRTSGSGWASAGDFSLQNNNVSFAPNQLSVYPGGGGAATNESFEAGNPNRPDMPAASFRQTSTYQIFLNLSDVGAWELNNHPGAPNIPAIQPTLKFALQGGFNNNQSVIGPISTVVPEPASLGVLAIGGLALLRRRR